MKLFPFLTLTGLALMTTGCMQTRQSQAEIEARQRALEQQQRRQQMEEYRRSVQMQMEDTESLMAESQMEIRNLQAELNRRPGAEELDALQNRVAALETMIQKMEVQRQKDREELLNALSQRMASILQQQQTAAQASSARTHVVASGETLSAIAAAYRVRTSDIIRINNLSNPNALRVGQKLAIPVP